MEKLDFFITSHIEAPAKLEDGQFISRHFKGEYNEYREYCVREGDYVIYYYGYHKSGTTTFFVYPTDEISDMITDIVNNIDIWNEPSVQKQWPYFYKAYKNYKSLSTNKIKLLKINDSHSYNTQHMVFAFTLNEEIPFEPTYIYRQQIHELIEYATSAIEEIAKDDGCLNINGQIRSFMRGMSSRYLFRRLFNMR